MAAAVEQQHPVWRYLEDEIDILLNNLQPVSASNNIRFKITSFLSSLLQEKLRNAKLVQCGSSCSRSYLPDGDLDLTLLTCLPCSPPANGKDSSNTSSNNNSSSATGTAPSSSSAKTQSYGGSKAVSVANSAQDEMQHLTKIFTVLCEEIYRKEEESQSMKPSSEFTIRNVEFINARTKLIHCVVNNVGVDITLNQTGVINTLLFLEEADKLIGNDHLFKKSLILIKCWSLNESVFFCGQPIIGSKEGMLSSYAVSILVLHLFNRFGTTLTHPFAVLRMFFFFYAGFPWESAVLTLEGAKPIQHGGAPKELAKFQLCANRFQPILDEMASKKKAMTTSRLQGNPQGRFSIRSCNIQDPVDENNNLGISVSRANLGIIDKALYFGYTKLESIIGQVSMANFVYNPSSNGRGSPPTPVHGQHTHSNNNNINTNNGANTPSSMAGYSLPASNGDRRRGSRPGGAPQPFPHIPGPALVPGNNPNIVMEAHPTQFYFDPSHATVSHIPVQAAMANGSAIVPIAINIPQNPSPPTGTFLKDFFPHSCMKHLSVPSQRSDLLDHPMQANRPTTDLSSLNMKPLQDRVESSSSDALLSDLQDLERAIQFLDEVPLKSQEHMTTKSDIVESIVVPEVIKAEEPLNTALIPNEVKLVEAPTEVLRSAAEESETTTTTVSTTASSASESTTVINIVLQNSPAVTKSKKKNSAPSKNTLPAPSIIATPEVPSTSSEHTSSPSSSVSTGSTRKRTKSSVSDINPAKGLSNRLAKYKIVGNSVVLGSILAILLSMVFAFCLLGEQRQIIQSMFSEGIAVMFAPENVGADNTMLSLSTQKGGMQTFENQSASENENRNRIITHWVQLGDSVTFGDFGDSKSMQVPAQYAASQGIYLWQKDSVNISSSALPYFTITNSNFEDAGHYRCLRLLDSKSYVVTETIIRISKKPKVKNRPFYKEVKMDGAFQIHLDVEGVPPPGYQWFRNGYPLEGENNQVLVIDKMDRSLAGTYSCEVKNIAGSFLWLEATIAVPD